MDIRLVDLRDPPWEGKSYDQVVPIEMLEGVGPESLDGRLGPFPVCLDVA